MSYLITYGDRPKDRRKPALGVLVVVLFFVLGCYVSGSGGGERMQRFRRAFLPWTQPQVQDALADFREDMRSGVSFSEAVEVFCRELIHEANPIG